MTVCAHDNVFTICSIASYHTITLAVIDKIYTFHCFNRNLVDTHQYLFVQVRCYCERKSMSYDKVYTDID